MEGAHRLISTVVAQKAADKSTVQLCELKTNAYMYMSIPRVPKSMNRAMESSHIEKYASKCDHRSLCNNAEANKKRKKERDAGVVQKPDAPPQKADG